jgi:peptidoglycan LD-endopeptidase LytH
MRSAPRLRHRAARVLLVLAVAGLAACAPKGIDGAPTPGLTGTTAAAPTQPLSTSLPSATPSAVSPVTLQPTTAIPAPPSQTLAPPTNTLGPPTQALSPAKVYVFPVQPINVTHYVQGHHDYPAVDIWAPRGSAFVAVTNGVVDWVNNTDRWDPRVDDPATRGGMSVAIVGDDGVRYYGAHLSTIADDIVPGLRVTAGQLLGRVGNSGNARYIATQLHFGLSHPTTPDDWKVRRGEVDPYPYLRAWAAGQNVTPVLPKR